MRKESFTLVNAETNEDIGLPANGVIVNLVGLSSQNLNVRASTNPVSVGSVRFGLNENIDYKLDKMAPYALADDIAYSATPT